MSKMIKGGCRRCHKEATNKGRGLCGVCYGEERKAGTVGNWPKLTAQDLACEQKRPLRMHCLTLGNAVQTLVSTLDALSLPLNAAETGELVVLLHNRIERASRPAVPA